MSKIFNRIIAMFLFTVFITGYSSLSLADDRGTHIKGLHFSHPLITESPSPDTKIRLDYIFKEIEGGHHGEGDEEEEEGG